MDNHQILKKRIIIYVLLFLFIVLNLKLSVYASVDVVSTDEEKVQQAAEKLREGMLARSEQVVIDLEISEGVKILVSMESKSF